MNGNHLTRLGVHGDPVLLFVGLLLHTAGHFVGFHLKDTVGEFHQTALSVVVCEIIAQPIIIFAVTEAAYVITYLIWLDHSQGNCTRGASRFSHTPVG